MPIADAGHVADAHGDGVALGDDDGADVVERLGAALDAHQQGLFAVREPAGAVVAIVGLQRLAQRRQADAARTQGRVVGDHLEHAHEAAEGVDVGHAGQAAQRRADHPVEQAAPLGLVELAAFDREHEHLAERCRDRCQAAGCRGGQVLCDVVQALGDLLARPVDVGAVVEVDGDVGDRVLGRGAQHALMRNAEHLQLDRHDDARLDLLGRHARRLHDDLDLCRGHVREGVDRQLAEGLDAQSREQQRENADQQPLREGEFDQSFEHDHSPPEAQQLGLERGGAGNRDLRTLAECGADAVAVGALVQHDDRQRAEPRRGAQEHQRLVALPHQRLARNAPGVTGVARHAGDRRLYALTRPQVLGVARNQCPQHDGLAVGVDAAAYGDEPAGCVQARYGHRRALLEARDATRRRLDLEPQRIEPRELVDRSGRIDALPHGRHLLEDHAVLGRGQSQRAADLALDLQLSDRGVGQAGEAQRLSPLFQRWRPRPDARPASRGSGSPR